MLSAITTGADEELLVVGWRSHSVVRFDGQTGDLIGVLVAPGSGGLVNPRAAAFGPDGRLYVTSNGYSYVNRYDGSTGAFIDEWLTWNTPAAGGGTLYSVLEFPVFLAWEGNELLLAAHNRGGIHRFSSLADHLGPFNSEGRYAQPNEFVRDIGGDYFVTCAACSDTVLKRFDATTRLYEGGLVAVGDGGIADPWGTVFGPDGRIYMTNHVDDVVRRYDTQGRFVDTFVAPGAGGLDGPVGVRFGPDGDLYVSGYFNDAVLRYDGATGDFVEVFASGGGLDGPMYFFFTEGDGGCRADLNGDGGVNLFDFLTFQTFFGEANLRADFNLDGSLTIFDFLGFQTAFGDGC